MPIIIGFTASQIFFIPPGEIVSLCFQLPMSYSSDIWCRECLGVHAQLRTSPGWASDNNNIAHTASLRTMDTMLFAIFFSGCSRNGHQAAKRMGIMAAGMISGRRLMLILRVMTAFYL